VLIVFLKRAVVDAIVLFYQARQLTATPNSSPSHPFSYLFTEFDELLSHPQLVRSVIALVNALVETTEHVEKRLALRNELFSLLSSTIKYLFRFNLRIVCFVRALNKVLIEFVGRFGKILLKILLMKLEDSFQDSSTIWKNFLLHWASIVYCNIFEIMPNFLI
jgi:hypothetical protein